MTEIKSVGPEHDLATTGDFVVLHHLTSIYHLPLILGAAYLKVTESNVSLDREHVAPDVVWLTTSRRAGQGWAEMSERAAWVDKTRIQFELRLPLADVHPWYTWAKDHGSDEHHMRALAASGDERMNKIQGRLYDAVGDAALARAANEWFVIERQVPWMEWVRITDHLAGTVIWSNSEQQATEGALRLPRLWMPTRPLMSRLAVKDGGGAGDWVPTTILSEEDPSFRVEVGGGEPDSLILRNPKPGAP